MARFLGKSLLFLLCAVAILAVVLMNYGGYVDYFYEKFTSPPAHSLILGDSRSMQGIQPSVIASYFGNGPYATPILNYSFTDAQMAYGEIWTKSVLKKLDTTSRNGLFILTVSPWMMSRRETDDELKKVFFEADVPPNNMWFVSMDPNFEYVLRNLTYFHFRGMFRRTSRMHEDGWLEEGNLPTDGSTLAEWKRNQARLLMEFSRKLHPSEYRMREFAVLVQLLKTKGDVVLVRMPLDTMFVELEERYWDHFDDVIGDISARNGVKYFNFTRDGLHYTNYDGNHIDKYGGAIFTRVLCDSISAGMVRRR